MKNDETRIILPKQIKGNLHNSGMGWVFLEEPTYAGMASLGYYGDMPDLDNVSLSTSWAHIEIENGVFDWTNCDRVVKYWTKRGKRVILRICTDTLMLGYTFKGVPDWLLELDELNNDSGEPIPDGKADITLESKKYYDYVDGAPMPYCYMVNLTSPTYKKYLHRFLRRLAEHFGSNSYVDIVEIRGYGIWGEWHSGHSFESESKRIATLRGILDEYNKAFEGTGKLMVVSSSPEPTDYCLPDMTVRDDIEDYAKYIVSSGFDRQFKYNLGSFRRDGAGNPLMKDNIDYKLFYDVHRSGKRVPLLAEYASSIRMQKTKHFKQFGYRSGIDDILFRLTPNYITVLGWVCSQYAENIDTDEGYTALIERANALMGYRLSVLKAEYPKRIGWGETFELETTFCNHGLGILWQKVALTIHVLDLSKTEICRFTNTKAEFRTIKSGEPVDIITRVALPELSHGEYLLAISLDDANGKPAIRLAMGDAEEYESKIYTLGSFIIENYDTKIRSRYTKMTYKELQAYTFDPKTCYSITFGYTARKALSEFNFNTNDCYYVDILSGNRTERLSAWQDVSGEYGERTVKFMTGKEPAKLDIDSDEFGGLTVRDIYVCKQDFPICTFVRMRIHSEEPGDSLFEYFVKTEPNMTYEISFDYVVQRACGIGGYYFLHCSDGNNLYEWYDRADGFPVHKRIIYTETDRSTRLCFGVREGGDLTIYHLEVSRLTDCEARDGTNIERVPNVVHNHDALLSQKDYFEDFESASFDWSIVERGSYAGFMTSDKRNIISGNTSLWGMAEPNYLTTDLNTGIQLNRRMIFANTRREVKFVEGKTYEVSFKYKMLKPFTQGGNCFVTFSSYKRAGEFWSEELDGAIGEVRTFYRKFRVLCRDCWLTWGMFKHCEIAIDDLSIKRLD